MRTTALLSFCLALLSFSTASPVVAGQHGVVDNQLEAINAVSSNIGRNSGGGTPEGLPDSGRDSHGNPNSAGRLAERCLEIYKRPRVLFHPEEHAHTGTGAFWLEKGLVVIICHTAYIAWTSAKRRRGPSTCGKYGEDRAKQGAMINRNSSITTK
ncbi:hypothetical protein BKA70DRAFT_1490445 [Coprinopsis sp. MPI-PUGE-AT-0042]|nr:hypothetical protein BKA70DRAFT_1490445 [Coprinopsis sp. MPI-PUGE-AT-0042]